MTRKRIQVYSSHLPRRTTRNRSPLRCTKFQRSQHLKWHIWHNTRFALLERLEVASNFRQSIERVFAADEVTEQCFARFVLWLWMDHLHDISQRRVLAHIRLEEHCRIASVKPLAHEPLRRRTKRLATHGARTQDLHKVAQHLCVIDHAWEDTSQYLAVLHRQHGAKQRRHVLHETALAAEHCGLGDELSVDVGAQLKHLPQLLICTGVESCVQTTGRSVLRQLMLWRKSVRRSALFVDRISSRNQLAD